MSNCSSCSDPNEPFSCGCFNQLSDKQAGGNGDILARMYKLYDSGQILSSPNSIIANVISYGFIQASYTCQQSFVNQQSQDIQCDDNVTGERVRNNINCHLCTEQAKALVQKREALEAKARQLNPNYTPQTVSEVSARNYNGYANTYVDGICRYVCQQCVVENTQQNIQMRITAECKYDTQDFRTAFLKGMSLQAQTELSRMVEALRNTGAKLSSQADLDQAAFNMAFSLTQITSDKQLSSMRSAALNLQKMSIAPHSTSVVIQNASQSISASAFTSLISHMYTDSNVKNAIRYDTVAPGIDKVTNLNDTIRRLSNAATTIQDLLTTTLGQIVLILIALFFTIALVAATLFFFNPKILFVGALSSE